MVGCGTVGVDIPNRDLNITYSCPDCGYTALRHSIRPCRCRMCNSEMHVRSEAVNAADMDLDRLLRESHSSGYLIDVLSRQRDHFTQAAALDPDWKPLVWRIDDRLKQLSATDHQEDW